jgi:lia operon protein LiaG
MLNISIQHPKSVFNSFGSIQNYRLDVHIPSDYSDTVEINTVSSDVTAHGLELKSLKCGTVSGSINIEGSYENLKFDTVSGSLISGFLNTDKSFFHSTSGSMKADSFKGDLDFSTTSGSLDVKYSDFNNNINITSVSGDSKIRLPENSQFYLKLDSISGSIKTQFPVTLNKAGKNSIEGTVVSGNNRITGKSTSGNFLISR